MKHRMETSSQAIGLDSASEFSMGPVSQCNSFEQPRLQDSGYEGKLAALKIIQRRSFDQYQGPVTPGTSQFSPLIAGMAPTSPTQLTWEAFKANLQATKIVKDETCVTPTMRKVYILHPLE